MKPGAEAKVRSRLMALKATLEGSGDPEAPASLGRGRLGGMAHQRHGAGDDARRQAEMARLDTALARLDAGKYGYCVSCGREIEDRRLEADPAVANCAACGGDQQ
jgi:RNA polymerase-binding transcription factor